MSRDTQPRRDSKRRAAINVMCPQCGALSKFLCVGTRGNIRNALHRDRYAKAGGELPA